jgi:hypothetical protein
MDYKQIITGFLSKTLKMDDGAVAELLNENGENVTEETILSALLAKDSARILAAGPKAGQTFQDGYKKGKSESLTNLEKEVKELYGFESDKTGAELVADIIASASSKDKDLNDENVLKHPKYIEMVRNMKRDIETAKNEGNTALEALKKTYASEKTFDSVKSRALRKLDGLNPILPANADVAAKQKEWFVKSLDEYVFEQQGDNIIVMKKDGTVAVDNHGHNVEFDDLITNAAKQFFEFKANNGGKSPGNNNDEAGKGKTVKGYPTTIPKPTSYEHFSQLVADKQYKHEDRMQLADAYEAEHSQA